MALAGGLWLSAASVSVGGGGPENVLLLVNSNSDSSRTIANHYIELRKIPPQNVVYMDWRAGRSATTGKTFRNRILMPAFKAIEDRRLGAQIDYVVYSSDFPWRIDLGNLFPGKKLEPPFDGAASLTGATYLAPFVVSESPGLVMPDVNWYVPGPPGPNVLACQQLGIVPSRGFRSRYRWDRNGKRTTDSKASQRYLLSAMLGVTDGRGNTVPEILSYLQRAAAADGTQPRGTIYFMANNNVRSKTRDKCYSAVASQIQRLGVRAVVERGSIPKGARDVLGVMAGVADFDWSASGSMILPGAICDHLTSYGGVFKSSAGQTPLSEFLRHGAAGASGTVKEPRNIQAKFPLPSLHLHYVRGCSLAEAFYQSVSGPYQLLVVGDPLCQPWARRPEVELKGIEPGQEVRGSLTITPSAAPGVAAYELFVDGRLTARMQSAQTVKLDTTKLADGYHELRLVGVRAGSIETQGRSVVPIHVKNHDTSLDFKLWPLPSVGHSGQVLATVRQPGATAIVVRQNSREVGRVEGEAGELEIAAATLGRGPTTLQAFSKGSAPAVSPPVRIEVQ